MGRTAQAAGPFLQGLFMYPLMLYRGGVALHDYITVSTTEEQERAEADGFARLDMAAIKGGPAQEKPKEPVSEPVSEPVKRGPGRPRKQP